MSEQIIIEYVARVDSLEKGLRKAEDSMRGVENTAKKGSKEVQKELKNTTKSAETLKNKFGELARQLPFAGGVQQVMQMGSALGGLVGGVKSASSAMNVFKIALASSGIGLIVVALGSLIAYFKKTDDGATKLAGIMKGLEYFMAELLKPIIEIGKWFEKAFSDPKQAMIDLGELIKENLINRVKSFGVIFQGVWKMVTGDFKEGAKEFLNGTTQLATGITDVTDKLDNLGKGFKNAMEQGIAFEDALDKLQDKERDLRVETSKNEIQIAKLVKQAKNRTLSEEERIALLKQASALEEKTLKRELDIANERLNLIKQENALLDKNGQLLDDNKDAQAEIEVKINQLKLASIKLQEKINNEIAALKDEAITTEIEKEQKRAVELENIERTRLLNKEQDATTTEHNIESIAIASLEKQKEILLKHGKDVSAIDKAILDIRLNDKKDNSDKELAETIKEIEREGKERQSALKEQLLEKKITQEQFDKLDIQNTIDTLEKKKQATKDAGKSIVDIEGQILDEKLKLNEKELKELKDKEDKKKEIIQGSLNVLGQAASGYYDLIQSKEKMKFDEELSNVKTSSNEQIKAVDARLKAGVISEELAAAQKERIAKDLARKESDIKKKQFIAEKNAKLAQIAIETALGLVRAFAMVPIGYATAALLVAQSAVSAALVQAQPVPKFEKGGRIGGKRHSQGGTLIEAEVGEHIHSRKAVEKYSEPIDAIQKDSFNDLYVRKEMLVSAMRKAKSFKEAREEKQLSTALKIAEALGKEVDLSHLEYLTKKNKAVKLENVADLADRIASNINLNTRYKA